MTTEERQKIRQGLLSLGFRRVDSTRDSGNGAYTERWEKRNHPDVIEILWGPKTS